MLIMESECLIITIFMARVNSITPRWATALLLSQQLNQMLKPLIVQYSAITLASEPGVEI